MSVEQLNWQGDLMSTFRGALSEAEWSYRFPRNANQLERAMKAIGRCTLGSIFERERTYRSTVAIPFDYGHDATGGSSLDFSYTTGEGVGSADLQLELSEAVLSRKNLDGKRLAQLGRLSANLTIAAVNPPTELPTPPSGFSDKWLYDESYWIPRFPTPYLSHIRSDWFGASLNDESPPEKQLWFTGALVKTGFIQETE